MSIYKAFEEKTTAIRKKFRDFENATNNDKRLDAQYKQQTIKEAYTKVVEEMKVLKSEYHAAKEQSKREIVRQAFTCQGNESEYLQTMAHVDGMDNAHRQRAASNALSIGAADHVRAIANSAYNNGDRLTLRHIQENADSDIAEPINRLLGNSETMSRAQEIKWEMFTFNV